MSWMDLYPRPQMRRASYYPLKDGWALNGQPIRMPFPPQSPLSGWEGDVPEEMDYEIRFTLPEGFLPENYRLILHVGAADQIAQVIFNGQEIMRHEGGYLPFSMDVTAHLKAENYLRIHCTDTLDHTYPYGKQTQKRGGMWYTPVSGLWQPVWLEAVPRKHIQGLKITPDLTGITLKAVASAPCQGVIRFGDAQLPIPLFDPAQPLRIEIILQHFAGGLCQGFVVVTGRLQLHDQRCFPLEQLQHMPEFGDDLFRTAKTAIPELLCGQIFDLSGQSGYTLQGRVVDHRQISVGQKMYIQLHAVACILSCLKGRHAVFRDTFTVQSPVGIAPAVQLL